MAGTIQHSWNGTVLTITSDSGTSSCDLKGAKGDDGARGAQGAPGSSVAEDSQKLGGVAAAQYALKNNVPAHNLLDNSDFTNPVNQRGATSYTGTGGKVYTIDRWHTWSNSISVSVQSGYLSVTNSTDSIYQNISQIIDKHNLTGKAATIAVWDTNGNVYCASGLMSTNNEIVCNTPTDFWFSAVLQDDNTIYFAIKPRGAKTATIKAAALYEGSYDASTLPAYVPKGYAAELAECQRYFTRVGNSSAYGIISGTGCVVKIPLPTTMRNDIVPTITLDSPLWVYSHEGYVSLNYIGTTYSTNTASLHFTVDTSMSARSCVVPDLSCNISADL